MVTLHLTFFVHAHFLLPRVKAADIFVTTGQITRLTIYGGRKPKFSISFPFMVQCVEFHPLLPSEQAVLDYTIL